MWSSKDIYFISDSTGTLATNFGQALTRQFPEINFYEEKFPFVKSITEAQKTMQFILEHSGGRRPIIFSTLVDPKIRKVFDRPEVELFDIHEAFLDRLEMCLEAEALRVPGSSGRKENMKMSKKVEAIHYCLDHDDGTKPEEYDEADVILLGVSRAGKTPVSVYMASHLGLKTANYPLTSKDLNQYILPAEIKRNKKRAVGITTTVDNLHAIRQKRYADSNYAKRSTCTEELRQAEMIFQKYTIPVVSSAGKSIEELAAQISQEIGFYKKP